jgi:RHS repeat-associated protein
MKACQNIDASTNAWNSGAPCGGMYENTFTYDANGNIATQLRKDASGTFIDEMNYKYAEDANKKVQNRLYHVNDNTAHSANAADDIDDQGTFTPALADINTTNNYGYDPIGNLIRDDDEEIGEIVWSVSGKIKEIKRANGSTKQKLTFDYDATGNRIAKHVYNGNVVQKSEYYVRDAQGNTMSIYKRENINSTASLAQTERNIYGSSMMATDKNSVELIGAPPIDLSVYKSVLGYKQFSCSNHLGNVLAVVSDKKKPHSTNGTDVDYFTADIQSASDYYPFGAPMAGRTFSSAEYRYGFNGKEKDDEVSGNGNEYDFGARVLDVRLGKWFSVDPYFIKYPNISTYAFAANSPILLLDKGGNTVVDANGNVVDVTFNKDGTLGFTGPGELSSKDKAHLQNMASTDIGRLLIDQMILSKKLIHPTLVEKFALIDAKTAKGFKSYKKQFKLAFREGLLKKSELVQGNYFVLEGLTSEKVLPNGKTIIESATFLGSQLFALNKEAAVENAKKFDLQIYKEVLGEDGR